MNKEQLKHLAQDVREARKLGQAAADQVDDGGTCNMDTVTLYLPGTRITSVTAAGIDAYKLTAYIALRCSFGQANKNTAGVRAVADYLKSKGHPASVWYQMD